MNVYLMDTTYVKGLNIKVERLKGLRKKQPYKDLVQRHVERLRAPANSSPSSILTLSNEDQAQTRSPPIAVQPSRERATRARTRAAGAIGRVSAPLPQPELRPTGLCTPTVRGPQVKFDNGEEIERLVEQCARSTSHRAGNLVELARNLLAERVALSEAPKEILRWVRDVFPPPREALPARGRPRGTTDHLSNWRRRRREYAAMQALWQKDMSRAAKLVLDGEVKASEPSLEQMYEL
uniref:Uncharacterized protein n=1 Tax=Trichogramma kaykai TaxID=54128 RepID=A0ABD2XNW4_9HYME